MTEHHCPNCSGKRPAGDSPCPRCGWMPLRATELTFVGDAESVCPHCARPRPDLHQACPHCGHSGSLDSLSQHTANFHISSLLLLTTLVAVCFALARVALWLGIPAFILAGLALYRTVLLIRERKRHRYPVATRDLLRLFAWNFFGIIVGLFIFALTLIGIQMLVIAFAEAFSFRHAYLFEACALIVLVLSQLPAVFLSLRRNWGRGVMVAGAVAAAVVAACIDALEPVSLGQGLRGWLSLIAFSGMAAVPIILAGRRGGAARAKAFIVGWSAAGSVLLLLAVTRIIGSFSDEVAAIGAASVLLWPTLFSIWTLQAVWSWDDAFPAVIGKAHHQAEPSMRRLQNPLVIEDEEEPITFLDEAQEESKSPD